MKYIIFSVFIFFLGCVMPVQEHWLTSFPSPSPDGNTSPLTLAIVVDDQRPDYNPSKATLSLVPLV